MIVDRPCTVPPSSNAFAHPPVLNARATCSCSKLRVLSYTGVAVLAWMSSRAAHALGNDTVFLQAQSGLTYNSNILGVANDAPPAVVQQALQGRPKGGWIWDYGVGLRLDVPVSQQRLRLDASATRYDYREFSELDYTGYDVKGVWNWKLGDRWRGNLGASAGQSRQNFLGGTSVSFPALVKNYASYVDATYQLTPRWEVTGSLAAARLRYDTSVFSADDFNSTTQSLTAAYRSRAGNAIGLRAAAEQGKWPNHGALESSLPDRYRQHTLAAVIDWTLSGRSQINGQLGYTRHDSSPGGRSGGPSGQFTYRYSISGKSEVRASAYNQYGPLDDVNASYVRTTGIDAGFRYAATEKITLDALASIKSARYLGGLVSDRRTDDFRSLSLAVDYRLSRTLTISAGTQYEKRTSDVPASDFGVYTVFLRAAVQF